MTMNDESRVWLLPHPGPERGPKRGGTACPWPEATPAEKARGRGPGHKRKFLKVRGEAIAERGKLSNGELFVWCEYEAPTDTRRVGDSKAGPRFVHTVREVVEKPELNTDPWIFQRGFVWSICGQPNSWHFPESKPPRHPRPGDLALFGSWMRGPRKQWNWLLDTVIVIEQWLPSTSHTQLGEAYHRLVKPGLKGIPAVQPLIGRDHEAGGCFSFAPCKPAAADDGVFQRPVITKLLKRLVVSSSNETPRGGSQTLTQCCAKDGVEKFWRQLRDAVWSKGLNLGVRFELPSIQVGSGNRRSKEADC